MKLTFVQEVKTNGVPSSRTDSEIKRTNLGNKFAVEFLNRKCFAHIFIQEKESGVCVYISSFKHDRKFGRIRKYLKCFKTLPAKLPLAIIRLCKQGGAVIPQQKVK